MTPTHVLLRLNYVSTEWLSRFPTADFFFCQALDFLSTAIVWTTTRMIERQDQYLYPVGRRRLEPIGVLVFSVIMVTSFFQVALQCFSRLTSEDHSIINLGLPAIDIMSSTVLIKTLCWLWCRVIKNSSVQALAQDAVTYFTFSYRPNLLHHSSIYECSSILTHWSFIGMWCLIFSASSFP